MDFWIRLDNLIASSEFVIDRPKGNTHPRYPELVYPLDYGYLKETSVEMETSWTSGKVL